MHTLTFTGPAALSVFVKKCSHALFTRVQYQFFFPNGCSEESWPADVIKSQNAFFLKNLIRRANVYAIFIRPSESEDPWCPVYVGQRESLWLRERITQHFIKKSEKTSSMLEKIKNAVTANKEIGLSFIKIEPESLRLYVEKTIIKNNKEKLIWNTHG